MNPKDERANKSPEEILSLSSFIGQRRVRERIQGIIAAAKETKNTLFHLLLCGPPDSGKTTLAMAIAREMGIHVKLVGAAIVEREDDLVGFLTNLEEGDFLLIEQIDLLKRSLVDVLFSAAKDCQLGIWLDQGVNARPMILPLKPFTLVGTTTRSWQVDKRLRRFMLPFEFDPYSRQELAQIVQLLGKAELLGIESDAALLLAEYCEGSPGVAKSLVERLRLFGTGTISTHVAKDRKSVV